MNNNKTEETPYLAVLPTKRLADPHFKHNWTEGATSVPHISHVDNRYNQSSEDKAFSGWTFLDSDIFAATCVVSPPNEQKVTNPVLERKPVKSHPFIGNSENKVSPDLIRRFESEFKSKAGYITEVEQRARAKTLEAIEAISKIKYNKAIINLTPDRSVRFKLIFGPNEKIDIEIYFDPLEDVGYTQEAFFSYYHNGEFITTGSGTLENVLIDVKRLASTIHNRLSENVLP